MAIKGPFLLLTAIAFLHPGLAEAQAAPVKAGQAIAQSEEETSDTPSASHATQPSGVPTKWVFIITPYLWASSSKTEFTTRAGEKLTAKDSFLDLLKDLKFAFMGGFEARHGRLVLLGDLFYVKLADSAEGHLGPIPLSADAHIQTLLATGLAGYRAVDHGPVYLDLMGGARLTGLKTRLSITGPLETHTAGFKKSQIAPVLGARLSAALGGPWGVVLYGDAAGFGINSSSSWQAAGTIHYDIATHWQVGAGWRHYHGRTEDKGFKLHQSLDGPIFTLSYRM